MLVHSLRIASASLFSCRGSLHARAAGLRPEIFNLALSGGAASYSVQAHCWVAFNLSNNVTGFQDIQYYSDGKGGESLEQWPPVNHP